MIKDNWRTYYSMEEAKKNSDKNIENSADNMIKDLRKIKEKQLASKI